MWGQHASVAALRCRLLPACEQPSSLLAVPPRGGAARELCGALREHAPHSWGLLPKHFPKAPAPNTIISGGQDSTCGF